MRDAEKVDKMGNKGRDAGAACTLLELRIRYLELRLWAFVIQLTSVPAFRCTSATLRCRCNPAAFGLITFKHHFFLNPILSRSSHFRSAAFSSSMFSMAS